MIYSDEREYHIGVTANEIGKYVIMPGDPKRCKKIAKYLGHSVKVADRREYTTYTGELCGEKVSVVSTGIGGPSAAIAIEELVHCGAHTFIRVGTSGGMQVDVLGGDLIIATGAIRFEGTSKEYTPLEYPAIANYEVINALKASSDDLNKRNHVGVVHCKDSFYGQHRPAKMPTASYLKDSWNAWIDCGAMASEMESAALFTVGSVRKVRVGTVLLVLANQIRAEKGLENKQVNDTESAIQVAVEAMKRLIEKDKLGNKY